MATTNKKQQKQQSQSGKSQSQTKEPPLRKRVEATLTRLERKDPGLKQLLKEA